MSLRLAFAWRMDEWVEWDRHATYTHDQWQGLVGICDIDVANGAGGPNGVCLE